MTTPAPTTPPPTTPAPTTPPPTTPAATTPAPTSPAPTTPPPTTRAPISAQSDNNVDDPNDGVVVTPGPTVPAPQNAAERDAQRQQQADAASQRATAAAAANSGVPQAYNVTVPFSGTSFTMGSAVGGAGASLVTMGQVLVDAVGTMALQSKGAFLGQTNASMALLSSAGTHVHTPAGIEIFAGGGSAPGACGCGGPATPGASVPPAQVGEAVTNAVCAGTSLAKAGFDFTDPSATGWTKLKAAADAVKAVAGAETAIATAASDHGSSSGGAVAGKVAGVGAEAIGGVAGAVAGALKTPPDIGSVVSGISNVLAAGGSGASAAKVGMKIEERASGNIKMVAASKMHAMAMDVIDFKTANKFGVNAGLKVGITTIVCSTFAAAKYEVKSFVEIKAQSGKFEFGAKAKADFKAKETELAAGAKITASAVNIKLDGVTRFCENTVFMEDTLQVKNKVELEQELKVGKPTKLLDTLLVGWNAKLEAKLVVDKPVVMQATIKIDKSFKVSRDITIDGETSLG